MSSRVLSLSVGFAGLGMILALAGCGGGGSSSAQVRVLQASPNTSVVNVLVDGMTDSSNLLYAANTGYISVKDGSRRIEVQTAGSNTDIVDQTISLASGGSSTMIVTGLAPTISPLVLKDDNAATATETALVRVVNAAPSMGSADVYIVPSGTGLTAGSPTVSSLTSGQASDYQSVTLATGTNVNYSIYFVEAGTTLAFMNPVSITFSSGQIRTVVALNSTSGGFTSVTLPDLN
jgi:Domain of unknown function (DUF4397)